MCYCWKWICCLYHCWKWIYMLSLPLLRIDVVFTIGEHGYCSLYYCWKWICWGTVAEPVIFPTVEYCQCWLMATWCLSLLEIQVKQMALTSHFKKSYKLWTMGCSFCVGFYPHHSFSSKSIVEVFLPWVWLATCPKTTSGAFVLLLLDHPLGPPQSYL